MQDKRLVYSSETGKVTARPPSPPQQRQKQKLQQPPGFPDDGFVRISREKGQRGGKTVTVIRGLPERGPELEARVLELKRLCGAGGTLREGSVEIQGDHRERIAERLRTLGYKVKLAGG